MGKPHVHVSLIKLWADGAKIEWWCSSRRAWIQRNSPSWDEGSEYRVKPKPKVKKYLMAYKRLDEDPKVSHHRYLNEQEFESFNSKITLEWVERIEASMIEVEEGE